MDTPILGEKQQRLPVKVFQVAQFEDGSWGTAGDVNPADIRTGCMNIVKSIDAEEIARTVMMMQQQMMMQMADAQQTSALVSKLKL